MSTEQAMLALGDIYNKKSVYKSITLLGNEVEAEEVKEEQKDNVIEGNNEVKEEQKDNVIEGNNGTKEQTNNTHSEDGNTNIEKVDNISIKENAVKIIQDGKSESKVDTKELVKTGSIIGFEYLIAISMIMIIAGIIIIKKQKKQSVI